MCYNISDMLMIGLRAGYIWVLKELFTLFGIARPSSGIAPPHLKSNIDLEILMNIYRVQEKEFCNFTQ